MLENYRRGCTNSTRTKQPYVADSIYREPIQLDPEKVMSHVTDPDEPR